jgi:hypothetical protein
MRMQEIAINLTENEKGMKTMLPVSERERQLKMIREVMKSMEEQGVTVREAEDFPRAFAEELKKNSERFEKERPFAVYRN